jgi:hypothetical protein
MKFDLCQSISSPLTLPCTEESVKAIFDSIAVARHCEAYAATGNEEEKRALPAFCFQAHFTEGKRCNAGAQSSGLYILDVDHIEGDAYEFGRQIVDNWVATCSCPEIYLVHVTPSGQGLRIVAKARKDDPDTIAECQARLAKKLGVECDPAVKDLARASFAVPRKNVLYYNPAIFTDEPEKLLTSGGHAEKPANTAAENTSTSTSTSTNSGTNAAQEAASLTYDGVKVSDIVRRYFEINGKPQVGSRNTTLYKFARSLRYLCDFQPQLLAAAMPHFGLPDAEVESISRSACESSRGQNIPQEIADIVASLQQGDEGEADGEETGTAASRPSLPPLPPVIADFVKACPDDFKVPALLASLPPLGTQFTALRADYADNTTQSPSFMCVIEAPQASGKSFTRRIVDTTMRSIEVSDEQERLKEQAYREELKLTKNKAKQPSDPRSVIRYIPVSVSIAKLLQRLDYAGGRHLFSFSEELDTMTKSNKSGAWAQKSDIYRNAFDNAKYGQDYISEGTYSAVVPVYYNILVCGTPKAVSRFFRDAEDGLVSRFIFCQLPSQFGKQMPKFRKMDEKTLAALSSEVDDIAKSLGTERRIALPKVIRHLQKWDDGQRLRAVGALDTARDTFRRRAAVIGFRAAMVAFALWKCDRKKETAAARFGTFVAEQVLNGQLERFAQQVNEQSAVYSNQHLPREVLDLLPQEFTRDELTAALKRCGRKTQVKVTVCLWKRNQLIKEIERGKYCKL